MKKQLALSLIAGTVLLPAAAKAEQDVTNRLTFSARVGLNISARFKSVPGLAAPATPRNAPDGQPYNYDDGYVHTDISGNEGGQTWNWGYDNNSQVSGNSIFMSRSSSASGNASSFGDDPQFGAEVAYSRELARAGKVRFGVEGAVNWMNLVMGATDSAAVSGVVDEYAFTPGTTPPSGGYQGSFEGPGFVIGSTPVNSTTTTIPGSDHKKFDADIWGLRFGPYVELPVCRHFSLYASGGFALAGLDARANWSLRSGGSTLASGSGHDHDFVYGCYIGANAIWNLNDRWSIVAGAQFQDLGTYDHRFGGRKVEVDFGESLYVTAGLGYSF